MASDLAPLSGLMQINEGTKKKKHVATGRSKGKKFVAANPFP